MLMLVNHSISDQELMEVRCKDVSVCRQIIKSQICELKSDLNMTGCVSRDKFYTDRYAASLHEQKDLAEKAVHGERFLSIVSSTLKRSDMCLQMTQE